MHFNPQLFKVSIIQTKLFGPLDFELSRFHCILLLSQVVEPVRSKWSQYQEVGVEPVSDHEDTQYTTDKNYFKKQKQALKRYSLF